MVCPYCGTSVEGNSAFCPNCGGNIGSTAIPTADATSNTEPIVPEFQKPEEPIVPNIGFDPANAVQPVQPLQPMQPPYPVQPPVANMPKMGKGKYIRKAASKKVKVLSRVVWAVFLGIVIVLALGVNSVVSNSVTEIPAVKMVVPKNTATNLLEDVEGLDKLIDEADNVLDDVKDELTDEEYKVIKEALSNVKSFAENQSIGNTKAVVNSLVKASEIAEKYPEHEKLSEHFEAADFAKDIAEPMKIIDIAIYIVIGFAAFIALVTLLAVALKKSGIAIFALLLAEALCYFLAGPIYVIITAVLYIALVVMFMIINKEYKTYKRGY